jgi:hypothetical protein
MMENIGGDDLALDRYASALASAHDMAFWVPSLGYTLLFFPIALDVG